MRFIDGYLLLGLLVHVGFLGLVDWLGYRHLVRHGYHPSLLLLALLNVAIGFGLYFLVFCPLRQRVQRRRLARALTRELR
ncbi:MAG: hypothetical protein KatS3mg131_2305 [Candidatus Tectimicrobiota bacterium]|nr:MAG: hypothetical protein KatS3mg131_2305 [Candidatus Tectomicrobia bacterium]